MKTNIDLTNYLKGIAILTVISGHFSLRFMPEEMDNVIGMYINRYYFSTGSFLEAA